MSEPGGEAGMGEGAMSKCEPPWRRVHWGAGDVCRLVLFQDWPEGWVIVTEGETVRTRAVDVWWWSGVCGEEE